MDRNLFKIKLSIQDITNDILEEMSRHNYSKDDIDWIGVTLNNYDEFPIVQVSVENFFEAAKRTSVDPIYIRKFVIVFKDGNYIIPRDEYGDSRMFPTFVEVPHKPSINRKIRSLTNEWCGTVIKNFAGDEIDEIRKEFDMDTETLEEE